MSTHRILILFLAISFILSTISPVFSKTDKAADDDDEDLSFLEEPDSNDGSQSSAADHHLSEEEFDDDFDSDNFQDFDDSDSYKQPEIDEKDVVVLKERNFSTVIEKNKFVLVEFYAPWCGHCQALAPEYAAAATELKTANEDVVLAKVDATEENELAHEYDIQGFPTLLFFIDGVHKPYPGGRTK